MNIAARATNVNVRAPHIEYPEVRKYTIKAMSEKVEKAM